MNVIRASAESMRSRIVVVQIGDRFYVVEQKGHQVFCIMPSDMPANGGYWHAGATDSGAAYVSRSRTRNAAMAGFRREVKRWEDDYEAFEPSEPGNWHIPKLGGSKEHQGPRAAWPCRGTNG